MVNFDVYSAVSGVAVYVFYQCCATALRFLWPKAVPQKKVGFDELETLVDLAAADTAECCSEPEPELEHSDEAATAAREEARADDQEAPRALKASAALSSRTCCLRTLCLVRAAVAVLLLCFVAAVLCCVVKYFKDDVAVSHLSQGRLDTSVSVVRPPLSIKLQRQRMAIVTNTDVLLYKVAYYGTLHVGTPAKDFTMVFDTGSGHVILPSAFCRSESCLVHKRYRRSSSSSAVDIDHDGTVVKPNAERDSLTVEFGTGEVSGVFVEEILCMSDSDGTVAKTDIRGVLPPGCVKMRIIAATEMTDDPFKTFAFDGILGLGLDALSRTPEFNFMNMFGGSVEDQGGERPHQFGMFLGEGNEQSELLLGGWSQDRMEAEDNLTWNNVITPEHGHWMLEIKKIHVDGEVIEYCSSGCKVVVDSGTSLMSVPSRIFPEFFELMKHDAAEDGLCRGKGPQLHFELEHFTVTMGPEDYSRPEWYKDHGHSPEWGQEPVNSNGTRSDVYCRPMLMVMDMPEPLGPKLFIFGEPVLRKYYTVYDTKEKRVGFGRANHQQHIMDELSELDDNEDESWFFADDDDGSSPDPT